MPMHAVVSSAQSVLLSGYAKTQDNSALVKRTYIVSVGIMALIFLPMYAAIAAVADSVVLWIQKLIKRHSHNLPIYACS
jgi:hypothetical protein